MPDSRRIAIGRETTRAGEQPPSYTKTLLPVLPSPFAGATDGGDHEQGLPPHFDVGQMSALYHQWRYEVTQADLPPAEGGFWVLRTHPTVFWLESIVDLVSIRFDPSQMWPGLWNITYPPLNPPPGYPVLPSRRFLDDWLLTTRPTPPTKTWNARMTTTPATAVVAQDIDAVGIQPPFHLRKHDVNAVTINENHALDTQGLVPVCDFYPMMGPPPGG